VNELFPYWENDTKTSGLLIDINSRCKKCTTDMCKLAKSDDTLSECPYGFNYMKSDSKIFFGILVFKNVVIKSNLTKPKKQNIYDYPECCISSSLFENYMLSHKEMLNELDSQIQAEKETIIRKYVEENKYKDEYFNYIKKDMEQVYSLFHDYQQINGTIRRNINVLMVEKTKRADGEFTADDLSKCSQSEVAIYYASQILEEKINVAKALKNFAWLNRTSEYRSFSVHGCILKYIRMYKNMSDQKSLVVSVKGHSNYKIVKNPNAFSIIPHTFIDNAIKYSPKNETITVKINDNIDDSSIDFSVTSLGPKISDDESKKIFDPFYRGKFAKKMEENGAGYGLYIAQRIAEEHLNSIINVIQEKTKNSEYYLTTFSLKIPLK